MDIQQVLQNPQEEDRRFGSLLRMAECEHRQVQLCALPLVSVHGPITGWFRVYVPALSLHSHTLSLSLSVL
jgi:hypothetical protein